MRERLQTAFCILVALALVVLSFACSGCSITPHSNRISTDAIVEDSHGYTYWNCERERPVFWVRGDVLAQGPYARSVIAHELAHVQMALAHPLGCEGYVDDLNNNLIYRVQSEAYAFCAQSQWAARRENAYNGDLDMTMRRFGRQLSGYGFPGVTAEVAYQIIKHYCDEVEFYPV